MKPPSDEPSPAVSLSLPVSTNVVTPMPLVDGGSPEVAVALLAPAVAPSPVLSCPELSSAGVSTLGPQLTRSKLTAQQRPKGFMTSKITARGRIRARAGASGSSCYRTSVDQDIERLASMCEGARVAVLAGAGCSTESGIPDYRGPGTRARARNPIQFKAFMESEHTRQRYWARAVVGWQRFAAARPNPTHEALGGLEARGIIDGVVTQNVDGLHQAGGSRNVVELHGALSRVRCLECNTLEDRAELQARLLELNPRFAPAEIEMAPDGDAELPDDLVRGFVVAGCRRCSGPLKPDVVFFGESVPPAVVASAFALTEPADLLLVVGSSLTVFSGYRFVRAAAKAGKPVAIVNIGPTRGDDVATLKIEGRLGVVLPRLSARLSG